MALDWHPGKGGLIRTFRTFRMFRTIHSSAGGKCRYNTGKQMVVKSKRDASMLPGCGLRTSPFFLTSIPPG